MRQQTPPLYRLIRLAIGLVLACYGGLWFERSQMLEAHGFWDVAPLALCAGIAGTLGIQVGQKFIKRG